MIEEINSLGSIAAIEYLLNLDGMTTSETIESLRTASSGFFQSSQIFLSTLYLLKKMNYVDIYENKVLKKKHFNRDTFLLDFISYLSEARVLEKIFYPSNLKLDSTNNQYFLFTNSISLELSDVRNFLIESNFLVNDTSKLRLYINSQFRSTAESYIFPLIEKSLTKNGLTPEQLREILARQEKVGFESEIFVMNYERNRLVNHPRVGDIQHIALLNVSAGFDVLSFSSVNSYILDREIEVKSYVGKPSFYLSRNEFNRAEKNKHGYVIYLVDRESINDSNYHPIIIENPYESLKNSKKWSCSVESSLYEAIC